MTKKEKILKIQGCPQCPLSEYKADGKGWRCNNFKTKAKHIDINFISAHVNYPTWCPLKKASLKLVLQ
jgi:hypothetical protein